MSTPTSASKRRTQASTPSSNPSQSIATDAPQPVPQITPTTNPIPRPSTTVGRTYAQLHPVLLLLHFVQRFPAVVADPSTALVRDLGILALAQTAYSVICLPPTRAVASAGEEERASAGSAAGARRAGSAGKTKAKDASLTARISTALLALLLSIFAAIPVTFVGLVLLGGPLTTHHTETILCAAHIALLATPPLFYTHGVQPRAWREVAALMLPGDAVWGGSLGAVLGAWLGAIPIPLDWDRAWQQWPITIVAGAYGGWAVGRLLGEFVFWGRRVPMDAE